MNTKTSRNDSPRKGHTITTEEEYNIAVQRVVDLARDLPCLADAPGIDPFEPSVLDDWVAEKERTKMQLHCGLLVLAAYHPFHNWRRGMFDLDVACWVWDEAHSDAFTRWARDPVFVWDSMVPADLWREPPSLNDTASRCDKSLANIEAEFAAIRKKLGARNQRELTRILKVTAMLSRGGDDSEGHA